MRRQTGFVIIVAPHQQSHLRLRILSSLGHLLLLTLVDDHKLAGLFLEELPVRPFVASLLLKLFVEFSGRFFELKELFCGFRDWAVALAFSDPERPLRLLVCPPQ